MQFPFKNSTIMIIIIIMKMAMITDEFLRLVEIFLEAFFLY